MILLKNIYSHSYISDKPILKKHIVSINENIASLIISEGQIIRDNKMTEIIDNEYRMERSLLIPMKDFNDTVRGFFVLLKSSSEDREVISFPDELDEIMKNCRKNIVVINRKS